MLIKALKSNAFTLRLILGSNYYYHLLIIMAKSTELRQYLRHRYANILYFCEDMGIYVKFMICWNSEIIRLKNLWRDT